MSVSVDDPTGSSFDSADKHVVSTTANGVQVHGACGPSLGAPVAASGLFECAGVGRDDGVDLGIDFFDAVQICFNQCPAGECAGGIGVVDVSDRGVN